MVPTFNKVRTVGLVTAIGVGLLFAPGTSIVQAEETETVTIEAVELTPEEEAELLELNSEVRSRGISTGLSAKQIMASCKKTTQCGRTLPQKSGGTSGPGTLSLPGSTKPAIKWCAKADPDSKFEYENGGLLRVHNYGGRTRAGVYEIRNSWKAVTSPRSPHPRHRPWVLVYIKPPSPGVHIIAFDSTPAVLTIMGGKLRKHSMRETHNGKKLKPKYGQVAYTVAYNFDSDGKGGAKLVAFKMMWSPAPNQSGWSFLRGVYVWANGYDCS